MSDYYKLPQEQLFEGVMELRHLRYFVAIADCGSLMRASERLHVAQPALSVHLANLEAELSATLVTRSNRGVVLTEDGQVLYEHAVQLLRGHQDMIAELKARKRRPSGRVSIGMLSTMPALVSHRLCKAVREQLPDVRLYILEASSWALYEWLLDGRIDMAMLFSLPDLNELDTVPLMQEDLYLVGPPCEASEPAEVRFTDLLDYRLAMPGTSSTWRKALEDTAERFGKTLIPYVETESVQALKALAASGECRALIPGSRVREDARKGLLSARRVVDPEMRGTMSLASLSSRPLGLAQLGVRTIVQAVTAEITAEIALPQPRALNGIIRTTPTPITSSNDRASRRDRLSVAK